MIHHTPALGVAFSTLCFKSKQRGRRLLPGAAVLLLVLGTATRACAQWSPPPAPPSIAPLTGDDLKRDVARFLTQATFGPTNDEINNLITDINTNHGGDQIAGYKAWIDAQFALPQTNLYDFTIASDQLEWNQVVAQNPSFFTTSVNLYNHTCPGTYSSTLHPATNNRRHAWWTISINANDQLRQRVAFALNEIFVTSTGDSTLNNYQYGQCNFYDMLASYANGNFLGLLTSITRHPVMGEYLSSLENQKTTTDSNGNILTNPDENYAREVMQLFTIGLVQLNPDGTVVNGSPATYTNADVTAMARVLTGWSFSQTDSIPPGGGTSTVVPNTNFLASAGSRYFQSQWLYLMTETNFSSFHDTGPKTILGTTLPGNKTAGTDLTAAMAILFNHPNIGPFVCRRLIQRLVTSNPSPGYIYRVAQVFANDGTGTRGNMAAVIKAILTDYEARDLGTADGAQFGKQKEPLIRYMQLVRAFGGYSPEPLSALTAVGYPQSQASHFRTATANLTKGSTVLRFPSSTEDLSQSVFESPSVFNWFLPDYSPGGVMAGLVAPEMQVTTAPQVFSYANYMQTLSTSTSGKAGELLYPGTYTFSGVNTMVDVSSLAAVYDQAHNLSGATVQSATTAMMVYVDDTLLAGEFHRDYSLNVSGQTPQGPCSAIINAVSAESFSTSSDRAKEMLYLVTSSPSYIDQK